MIESDTVATPLLVSPPTDSDVDDPLQVLVLDGGEWHDVESQRRLEKGLLRKLDKRMSILVLMYILNHVSCVVLKSPWIVHRD